MPIQFHSPPSPILASPIPFLNSSLSGHSYSPAHRLLHLSSTPYPLFLSLSLPPPQFINHSCFSPGPILASKHPLYNTCSLPGSLFPGSICLPLSPVCHTLSPSSVPLTLSQSNLCLLVEVFTPPPESVCLSLPPSLSKPDRWSLSVEHWLPDVFMKQVTVIQPLTPCKFVDRAEVLWELKCAVYLQTLNKFATTFQRKALNLAETCDNNW